jgi:hypothetical protein
MSHSQQRYTRIKPPNDQPKPLQSQNACAAKDPTSTFQKNIEKVDLAQNGASTWPSSRQPELNLEQVVDSRRTGPQPTQSQHTLATGTVI